MVASETGEVLDDNAVDFSLLNHLQKPLYGGALKVCPGVPTVWKSATI